VVCFNSGEIEKDFSAESGKELFAETVFVSAVTARCSNQYLFLK
jgi:hypothetical protein